MSRIRWAFYTRVTPAGQVRKFRQNSTEGPQKEEQPLLKPGGTLKE